MVQCSGNPAAFRENYDLFEGIIVHLSKDSDPRGNDLIRYLQLLLTETASPEIRLKELEEKYKITRIREKEQMDYEKAIILNALETGEERGREAMRLEILARLEEAGTRDEDIMKLLGVTPAELAELRRKRHESDKEERKQ